jgi:hypothetical protein
MESTGYKQLNDSVSGEKNIKKFKKRINKFGYIKL